MSGSRDSCAESTDSASGAPLPLPLPACRRHAGRGEIYMAASAGCRYRSTPALLYHHPLAAGEFGTGLPYFAPTALPSHHPYPHIFHFSFFISHFLSLIFHFPLISLSLPCQLTPYPTDTVQRNITYCRGWAGWPHGEVPCDVTITNVIGAGCLTHPNLATFLTGQATMQR